MFAESFLACERKLARREWREALAVAVDVQRDRRPAGLHVEPLAGRDDLWSARVTQDIRLIALRQGEKFIPLYVDHHDAAYRWAQTRRVIRDRASESVSIIHEETPEQPPPTVTFAPPPGRFDAYDDRLLLDYGFPTALIGAIRHIRTDDDVLNIAGDLPGDLGERLLALAVGKLTAPSLPPVAIAADQPAADAPAAPEPALPPPRTAVPLRLLDVDDADLRRVLDAPDETWVAFLHPSQRGVATRAYHGAARISGGAGTGKTVVAMHRARHLARQGRRVLLASFTNNASVVLDRGVRSICTPEERERIMTGTVHSLAVRIVRQVATVNPPPGDTIRALIERFAREADCDAALAAAEWQHVIQALAIRTWEEYRDAQRTGRGKRLSIAERERLYDRVIVPLDAELRRADICDWPDICAWARDLLDAGHVTNPFDAVIVDEMQDLGPQELRFLAALAGDGPDCLTLVGDSGQRIYANRVTLRDLGIDVRGRTRTLTLNYRTTAEIARFAEAILGMGTDDPDSGTERRAIYSLRRGPAPTTRKFPTAQAQYAFVADEIAARCGQGAEPGSIAVLAPRTRMIDEMAAALDRVRVPSRRHSHAHADSAHVALTTIHGAKGLEFRSVFVIGASDEVVPGRLPSDSDERRMAQEEQRNLLYVAATRARDELCVSWTGEPSRFLRPAIAAMAYTAPGGDASRGRE